MVPVVWTEPARDDLAEIYAYIAEDSKAYARATVKRIRAKAGTLRRFPEMGHILPDYPASPYRQLACGSYRIIHRLQAEQRRVVIVAVIHAARFLPALLDQLTDE
jgi:plasmid stabilization system protein ParE